MHRRKFEIFFNIDRKILYITLGIVLISIFSLTIIYAALSTTLNINGNAEVTASSWDIYLDNVQLNSNSVTNNVPTITNKTTATFATTLSKPGDYYMFTIDVVNNGSIDAMIDSVTKIPELSDTQKKYLNYIVEYQNGDSINTKHLVSKQSFVRLKVKLEFRKDITAADLPTTSETLNLSFKINYVQSDENSENVSIDNNGKLIKIISGDYNTVGSEIAIGNEHFYVISSDGANVTMLAKYNLYVGNECTKSAQSSCTPYGSEATGIQESNTLGWTSTKTIRKGTSKFSSLAYWGNVSGSTYVYNNNSTLYNYIENYKIYLESLGTEIKEARLIKLEELISLKCSRDSHSCTAAPEWVYSTSYWTGTNANTNGYIFSVKSDGGFSDFAYYNNYLYGTRPVITITI